MTTQRQRFRDSAIRPGEAPLESVVRALAAQLDRVVAVLEDPDADPIEAVHRARKALKRARGLLRLIRDFLGRDGYRKLNRRLRDTARLLAPMRDAAIRLKTFETNRPRLAERVDPGILTETHECLVGERAAAYPDGRLDESILPEVREGTEATRRLLSRVSTARDRSGFAAIAHGLLRVYEAARSGMRAAALSGDFNEFHEWRKHVKYLRYQLEHLEPLAPEEIREMIAPLHQIDEYLGDAHDMWMLGNFTEAHPSCCEDRDLREIFIGAMDGKRHVLNSRALRVGDRLFAKEPGDFVSRMERYWAEAQ